LAEFVLPSRFRVALAEVASTSPFKRHGTIRRMAVGTDVLTRQQRSHCMSRIRGRDTGPELALRRVLFAAGARYRVNTRLPGRPDLVFSSARIAVFVDGCFWHACPQHSTRVKSRASFWATKIAANVARDRQVETQLRASGWFVIRVWEHVISENVGRAAATILSEVKRRQGAARAARSARRRASSGDTGSRAVSSTV